MSLMQPQELQNGDHDDPLDDDRIQPKKGNTTVFPPF